MEKGFGFIKEGFDKFKEVILVPQINPRTLDQSSKKASNSLKQTFPNAYGEF